MNIFVFCGLFNPLTVEDIRLIQNYRNIATKYSKLILVVKNKYDRNIKNTVEILNQLKGIDEVMISIDNNENSIGEDLKYISKQYVYNQLFYFFQNDSTLEEGRVCRELNIKMLDNDGHIIH
jgi:polygalacturonase